jgi:tricarballylate dehydrogenase
VGSGNAGFASAFAALERGREVLMVDSAPESESGGNSYFTAGATRIVHGGLEDLADIVEHDPRHSRSVVPPYSADDFLDDLRRVTDGRNDPSLSEVLISESSATVRWMAEKGVRYRLMYERQSYQDADGTYHFWGGLHVGNVGGGQGMLADYRRIAVESGLRIEFATEVADLLLENGSVVGVRAVGPDGSSRELRAGSTILASGGFEANPVLRSKYLGPEWARAKVRGTAHNTGVLLERAIAIGAGRAGDWSTCHSTAWDAFAADNESNREYTNRLTRQSYPLGIVVNRDGDRFFDEGADFRNYTYALYGTAIIRQPAALAFQIFDSRLRPLLRSEEYDMPGASVFVGDSIEALADAASIDRERLARTISQFNSSVDTSKTLDLTQLDGRRADVEPPKSNWASAITEAPFYAFPVTCGITFTFGGLRGDTHGRVLDEKGHHISGLFAVGEALGGLFSKNYPGGSGLTAGMVFGRRAGSIA